MSKYVKVALYDAEKKKTIGKTVTRDKFKSDREMKKHIDKIKEEQKEKNKVVKETGIVEKEVKIKQVAEGTRNNINNFILDKNTGNTTLIVGSSKRGKTTVLMEIYKKLYAPDKDFLCTLFSGNCHIGLYKGNKDLLIADGFNNQSEKYIKMEKYINTKTNNHYKFLNMFDDVIDIKYKKLIDNLILSYRNSNMSTIISTQYSTLISKMNRANVNNIILFGTNSAASKKDLIELYLKPFLINLGFVSYKDQINYFDQITNDHGFFYINTVNNVMTTHRIPKSH